jgi:hypothetical protein
MRKWKRTTRVAVETERTFVFSGRGVRRLAWCAVCGAEVEMAGVGDAASIVGLGELALYRLADARAVHFVEDEGGRVLICLDSLPGSPGHES